MDGEGQYGLRTNVMHFSGLFIGHREFPDRGPVEVHRALPVPTHQQLHRVVGVTSKPGSHLV